MAFIYIIMNIFYIAFSIKFYKSRINPISIYSVPWTTMVTFYEMKLVKYYDMTKTTWLVIILFQLVYIFGCVAGRKKNNSKIKNNISIYNSDARENEKDLIVIIILFSVIASISALAKFLQVTQLYGINLLLYTNELYINRVKGNLDAGIPYIGALVDIAIIYSGIYMQKYGFKWFLVLPIIVIILDSITSGGRLGFMTGFLLFLFPIVFVKDSRIKIKIQEIRLKFNKINKFKKFLALSVLIGLTIIITNNRAVGVYQYDIYMSSLMLKVVDYNPAFYKVYTYITTPIGVLNEFLKNPTFKFGGHTFLTLYNFLNKFGADISVDSYQMFYFFPISSNVGTYIRELIEDFTIPFGLVVTFITSTIFSRYYSKMSILNSYMNILWATTMSYIMFFSFFQWQLRSSSTWILLLVGSLSGYILDQRYKSRLKYEVKR